MSTTASSDTPQPKEDEMASKSEETLPRDVKHKKLIITILIMVIVLLTVGLIGFFLIIESGKTIQTTGSLVGEASGGEATDMSDAEETLPTCTASYRVFADRELGMAFCYPTTWGDAEVHDAKVGPEDAGYRQSVQFSDTPFFSVGGTSENWSTTVGRDVGCLEPNNQAAPLSVYDTAWHDMIGSGATIDYATRSLPSPTGGYDSTESVSTILQAGVCAQAHKIIDGSRYRVAFAAFYRDFAEASGITTPSLHVAEPTVLFSIEQRDQFDAVLESLVAY
jgi:hypothetical protein